MHGPRCTGFVSRDETANTQQSFAKVPAHSRLEKLFTSPRWQRHLPWVLISLAKPNTLQPSTRYIMIHHDTVYVIPSALMLNLSSRRHVARCSWDSWGRAMAQRSVRHPKAFLGGENALDATVEYIWKADSFVFVSDLDPAVLKHIETPLDPLGYKRRCQFFK